MPSVTFYQFLFATLLITPKLFLHVFVGSRLFELMDRDSRIHLDPRTKRLNLAYAIGGILIGAITGWVLWRETQKVLRELEEEDVEEGGEINDGENEIAQENQGLTPKKVSHKVSRRDRKVSLDGEEVNGHVDRNGNGTLNGDVEVEAGLSKVERGKRKTKEQNYGSTSTEP